MQIFLVKIKQILIKYLSLLFIFNSQEKLSGNIILGKFLFGGGKQQQSE